MINGNRGFSEHMMNKHIKFVKEKYKLFPFYELDHLRTLLNELERIKEKNNFSSQALTDFNALMLETLLFYEDHDGVDSMMRHWSNFETNWTTFIPKLIQTYLTRDDYGSLAEFFDDFFTLRQVEGINEEIFEKELIKALNNDVCYPEINLKRTLEYILSKRDIRKIFKQIRPLLAATIVTAIDNDLIEVAKEIAAKGGE